MKVDFKDITSRIEEKPTWYDINGTPRYGKPKPGETNLYANQSIAVVIGCQGCQEQFLVVYDADNYDFEYVCIGDPIEGGKSWERENKYRMDVLECKLVEEAEAGNPPHYGDPPRHNGCVGDTMNSYAIRTVGWWKKDPKVWGDYSFESCNWPGGPDWAKELIERDES